MTSEISYRREASPEVSIDPTRRMASALSLSNQSARRTGVTRSEENDPPLTIVSTYSDTET
ncbi:MAG: hypothetical protein BWY82_02772 [Verrucomicrobia bacterium ADurb.Bin474]|nr:MAG: hypothetical protein BWY82_02772 [Verrucomicrobia bacterium ADurb.Bin474]